MELPPILLDKEIRRAAAAAQRAREELMRDGPEGAPRGSPLDNNRLVSSRSTYLELGEMRDDPLLPGLRAWAWALTLERVLWPDWVRLATAWHEASIEMEAPERARLSPRELLTRVLADKEGARRRAWAEALARGASRVSDAARILAERRAEAIRRLGTDAESSADSIEVPCNTPGAAAKIAEQTLEMTEAMADLREGEPWDEAIARGVVRGATSGWPARLGSRWVEEQFRNVRLAEGLAIDLGKLPEPLGASSFARTLAAFGGSFARAAASPSSPFVLAHPPFDLRVARRRALFGALLADPLFGVHALGLGRDQARSQAREIARSLLAWLRLQAARVKLRGALLLPGKQRAEAFEEETARALGTAIPGSLAGVVPKLSPEDPARLLGAALAGADRRGLVERFDEDWFRNPHAAEALRDEEASRPLDPRVTSEELEGGLRELVRALEGWIT